MFEDGVPEYLVCPCCQGQLRWQPSATELLCEEEHLAFPVREGIPVLVMAEARAAGNDGSP